MRGSCFPALVRTFVLCLVMFCFKSGIARAADPAAQFIDIGHLGGNANLIRTLGDTAFLGRGRTLEAIWAPLGPPPWLQSSVSFPSPIQSISVSNSLVCVTDVLRKLYVLPSQNGWLAQIEEAGTISEQAYDAVTSGSLIFAATSSKMLSVYDANDPRNPALIGQSDDNRTSNYPALVAIDGNRALVTGGLGALGVYDVTDPTSPTLMGSVSFPGTATRLIAHDGMAYINTGSVVAIDFSDGHNPRVTQVDFGLWAAPGLALWGNTLYVAQNEDGFTRLDVTDPSNITLIDKLPLRGNVQDLAVDGDRLVAATGDGMQVIDLAATTP